jgi:hypothetical protein
MALGLKGASARSLKMRQNIYKILTFWNFPFLNAIKSKMDVFNNERSKDLDPTRLGHEKL